EPSFYQGHGISAAYVGHPMADQIPLRTDARAARRELGLDPDQRVVALLPGSRAGEVSRLSAPMIAAAGLLSAAHPDLGLVAAIANPRAGAIFRGSLAARPAAEILLIEGRPRTVMAAAD